MTTSVHRPFWKRALVFLIWGAVIYGGVGFGLKWYAGKSLYVERPPTYQLGGEYFLIRSKDGTQFASIYLKNSAATFTVLYLHGNGDELGSARPFVDAVRERGYSVMAIDYRGYGRSEGRPTARGVNEDALAALHYLRDQARVPLDRVIVLGYSLGGSPAVELAASEAIGGLALQAAYTSVFRIKSEFLARVFAPFDFNKNIQRIAAVKSPILLLHGTQDALIKPEHGYRLYNAAQAPRKAVWFSGVAHSPFVKSAGEAYWRALAEFAKSLPAAKHSEAPAIK